MPFPVWTPLAVPQLGSDFQLDEKVLENSYGDGISQAAADGLNAQFWSGTLIWRLIQPVAYQALLAHFATVGRHEPFLWLKPGEIALRQWRFSSALSEAQVKKLPNGLRFYSTSIGIKESFEVG
ncbi:hypothetical protein [Dongia sp.]|uniref:hypothetical protein n=1 Tax=Dongia sp. TaxID=1977262 RepID=UPI0035AE4DC9